MELCLYCKEPGLDEYDPLLRLLNGSSIGRVHKSHTIQELHEDGRFEVRVRWHGGQRP